MVLLGSGTYTYEVSGEDWGNLPEELSYREATALALDSHDNVHVFNRGSHPMIVLDPYGNVLRTWGEGGFVNPHGVAIGPDDSVYWVPVPDPRRVRVEHEGIITFSDAPLALRLPLLDPQTVHDVALFSSDPNDALVGPALVFTLDPTQVPGL